MKVERTASDLKLKAIGKRLFQKQSRFAPRDEDPFNHPHRNSLLDGEMIPLTQNLSHLNPTPQYSLYTVIQDPRVSRFTYNKLLVVQKNVLLISGLLLFMGMMKVEADVLYEDEAGVSDQFMTVMSITTAVLVLLTVIRKILIVQLQVDQKKAYIQKKDRLRNSSFRLLLNNKSQLVHLLIEIILTISHPTPILEDANYSLYYQQYGQQLVYSVNDLLGVLMMLKLLIILRSFVALTIFASPRASRLCAHNGLQHDFIFSIKCLQQQYPLKSIFVVFLLCLFTFGYGFRITQGNLSRLNSLPVNGFQSYSNCYWFTFITMATIGYGDYVPVTTIARILAVSLAIIGVLLNSLLVVALSKYLQMKMSEKRSHTTQYRLSEQKKLQNSASLALSQTIKIAYLLSSDSLDPLVSRKLKPNFWQLKKMIDATKNYHRKIKSTTCSQNITQQMMKSFQLIKDHFKDLYNNQKKIKQKIQYMEQKNAGKLAHVRQSFLNEVSNIMEIYFHN